MEGNGQSAPLDDEDDDPYLEYTPTQRKILRILSDGRRHKAAEIRLCLPDEMATHSTVRRHIFNIRKRLRMVGQDIVCEIHQGLWYRHIRMLRFISYGE